MNVARQPFSMALRVASVAVPIMLASGSLAHAHHAMGGRTPATLFEGVLSGLGHPVIGVDHLAFIVAVGLAVGIAGLSMLIPALFIAASAVGVALHVAGVALPKAELIVALSVLLAGALIATDGVSRQQGWLWAALFCVAGLFHGYAYGELIYGAELTPLAGYLAGLLIVQSVIATVVAMLARRGSADGLRTRLAGAAIAGVGIAVLAAQMLPA